jgi:hypothetical protein
MAGGSPRAHRPELRGHVRAESDDIREISAAFGRHGSNMARWKGAIVAGDVAHRSAVTLQQTIGPTGLIIMIFSDLESACEWLGISIEDVAPTIEELRSDIRSR